MIRFVTVNDLHLSTRPPRSRTDDYISELIDLLEQVADIAKAIEARAVLIPGDIFNLKGLVSYELLIWLYDWCRRVNAHAIPGNHDLIHNRLASLPETALGFLFETGVLKDVSYAPYRFTYNNAADPKVVSVVGVPFPDAFEQVAWQRAANLVMPEERAIVLGHCFASLEGGEHFGEPVLKYADLAPLPFDVFVFGHDHTDHGIQQVGGKTFINLGALCRNAMSHDDLHRPITCGVIEVDDEGAIRAVQVLLKYKPASEIFDVEAKLQRDAEVAQVETFVETLALDMPAASGTGLSFEDRVRTLNLPDAVFHRVLGYIADAEARP